MSDPLQQSPVCIDCHGRDAVTNDGKLCKPCLKKRIKDMNFIPKTAGKMRGYKSLPTDAMGGSCEIRQTNEDEE